VTSEPSDPNNPTYPLSPKLHAALSRFEAEWSPDAIAAKLVSWIDAQAKPIPHYASCMRAVLTRKGLNSLIRRLYKTHLAKLSPAHRRAWTNAYSDLLLRDHDPEERFAKLFTISIKEGAWDVHYLLNRDGRPIKLLRRTRPAKPGFIALSGIRGTDIRGSRQTTTRLSIDIPLPDIVRHVTDFVKLQRQIFSVPVPRGRKKGNTGARIEAAPAVFLAYLADRHGERKSDLLRLANRDTTAENYRWLERRLIYGRQYLKQRSWVGEGLESFSLQDMRPITRAIVLANQGSTED